MKKILIHTNKTIEDLNIQSWSIDETVNIKEFKLSGLVEDGGIITQIIITATSTVSLNLISNYIYDLIKIKKAKVKINNKTFDETETSTKLIKKELSKKSE